MMWRSVSRRLAWLMLGSSVLLSIMLWSPFSTAAAPPSQAPDPGKALFDQKCVGCHTLGGGVLVGPDLKGVTDRQTRAWLTKWLADPPGLVAQGDPIAVQLLQQYKLQMPSMSLAPDQVTALIDYLAAQTAGGTGTQPQTAAQPAPALLAGNAANGQSLFVGALRLQNGGAPCMSCHSIAGTSALGGGTLGPDLSLAFNKYGEAGLANFLNTYPLPTMKAVWTATPLTPQEQADLRVFLQNAAAGGAPDYTIPLAIVVTVGALALLVLAQFYWRKRLMGVRRPMIATMLKRMRSA